ncbi:YegP family protein [Larkinella harenae]
MEQLPEPNGHFRFRVMKNSREDILVSAPFATKKDCLMAVSSARKAGAEVANYPLWNLTGNIRFNLFYGNNALLIGTVRYKSTEDRDKALQELAACVAQLKVVDHTAPMNLAA